MSDKQSLFSSARPARGLDGDSFNLQHSPIRFAELTTMHLVCVNYTYPAHSTDPAEVLERYRTLTGWAEAVLRAGAERVTVAQRFARDASLCRAGVEYLFAADGGGPRARWWTRPTALHTTIARLRPDIVHVNGLIFPLQTRALRAVLPPTTALVMQDHKDGIKADALRRWLYRTGLRGVEAFLFTAPALALPWQKAGVIQPHQSIYTLAEGSANLQPLPREGARALSGVQGNPALLWVGRLNANKDPLTVLAGFEQALPALPEAELTMLYTEADLLPEIEQRLRAAPALARRVHLRGQIPYEQMPAFYSAADFFVLGSHVEGTTLALMEASACGLVPIVTDIPAFRALTAEGRLGALWPPGNSGALASALIQMSQCDLTPRRANITAHFEANLSWPALGRRALDIYRTVWQKARG